MKKINIVVHLLLLFVFLVIVSGCEIIDDNGNNNNNDNDNKEQINELTILYVNDFHGAIDETNGRYGIVRLGAALSREKGSAKASVLISGGDMFQGTALSNYDHGKTIVDIMNYLKFDAMVLGNHEFDWSYPEIAKYVDGNPDNGEANFPYLGCNIIEKSTNMRPTGTDAYTIVERGDLKIGIVGFMGENNASDITQAMIEDYRFEEPLSHIKQTVADLRVNKNVDIVIVAGHESETLNSKLANLTGNEKVDAILNAHTHYNYSGYETRSDGTKVPYLQAGSAGQKYGVIKLELDAKTKKVLNATSTTKDNTGTTKDSNIQTIVDQLKEETSPIFNRILGVAESRVDRYGGADWAATALKEYANTDFAVINIGGIRSQAFPIYQGESITVAKIYEIMPFDNVVKTVTLSGSYVMQLFNHSDFVFSANVTESGNSHYINGQAIERNKMYTVATIDYIFDKPSNPFLKGENQVNTGYLFRDVLIENVEKYGTIAIREDNNE